MNPYTEVLFEEVAGKSGDLGLITLNRPGVLNALNHSMIQAMHTQLTQWASADHIKAVVIQAAEGRAFCAGGDLRLMYDRFVAHDPKLSDFFRDEYQLNRLIFHYPKPYIALLDGITMGGGVGISIHGSHRVATERLMFAMPETGIGFYPDVGGTYFLPRLEQEIGFYLGLTGGRLGPDECTQLGLTQWKIPSHQLSALIAALAAYSFGAEPKAAVSKVISDFKGTITAEALNITYPGIENYFSLPTMEEIFAGLQRSTHKWCHDTVKILEKKSPTSLKVTLKALQSGRENKFDDCMQQEFRLTCRFLEEHDFIEGIRAVIIDKDQKPQWKPDSLIAVTPEMIQSYFAPLTKELV